MRLNEMRVIERIGNLQHIYNWLGTTRPKFMGKIEGRPMGYSFEHAACPLLKKETTI